MTERTERREPCGNCPFQRDAPLAHWIPQHYLMLADIQASEREIATSRLFACHKDKQKPSEEQGLCVGWMLDQRRRGVQSIALRLALACGKDRDALFGQFEEMTGDDDCYQTVEELVRVNIEADRELHPERYEDEDDDERLRGPCEECCAADVLTTCTACMRDLCSECFGTLGCCDRCTADMP